MSATDEAAVANFLEGYNCAQSVLASCGQPLGLPRETAMQVAQAFGGGLGRTGNVCGAVTGALMAIGLSFPANAAKDKATKDAACQLTREFMARFRARHGAINCRDLLGFDLSTSADHQKAVEAGVFKTVCPGLVGSAAQIVEELLAKTTTVLRLPPNNREFYGIG
jgi:C_GCAxxG_C_C family probable redox protein